ncbi:peptidylprolyl isomerase [Streptomyces litchfieldiae]|uniref:Peptidylprolyl isomerase n=1 Tax=Streptomyces litchfieldiae TaxID=3075543 RepID=A0ABU2MQE2_9ACTN|nr:peptidylprolyl isomerase [Streptomyces sp. DSM 44938]MDT0343696.1 peptidylprolyl isomerase [Streptomyces sp. DSM 44938]
MVSKEQRRKQLARAKWERQQERRTDRVRQGRRRRVLLAAVLVLVVAGGGTAWAVLAGDDGGTSDQADGEPSADPGTEPGEEPSAPPEDPCEEPAPGEPSTKQWDAEPEMTVDTSSDYVMTLATTCGDIEITMDAEAAPHTVNSFNFLANEGYFDHSSCHRLVPEGIFVLQCGDPQGTGQGGPGYTLPDENLDDPDLEGGVYPAGTVAMANQYNPSDGSGRDTGGSQFFLVYQDSELPPDYTPFGTITAGLDVLELIAGAGATEPDPSTGNTAPHATVVINEARVEAVPAE